MSSSEHKWVYDVFLSFRGEDTRFNFVSHLNSALKNAGIDTFIDYKLGRGGEISPTLINAIEGSNCAIVVLSENYASSKWCLKELEAIMRSKDTFGQIVLPIFYHVDPSDVRKQRGSYAEAFAEHDQSHTVQTWKALLTEIANISGWDISKERDESEMIANIVEEVVQKLDPTTFLHIADYPVGIEYRVQEVVWQSLIGKSWNVRVVGIWGMGGVGKTTLAKAIYNTIARNFIMRRFLANIREVWKQDNGQVYLQNQLRKLFHNKKVFVVLDDVDELAQLRALCRRTLFGPGSVIIITTRDQNLLKVHEVDNVYPMREMENNEALELFSWHAFKEPNPAERFIELSRKVVSYCGGLPLALQVLGSFLFGRNMLEWRSVLFDLEEIPDDQVQKKLKLSFDGLNNVKFQDIFLDICCFFIGEERDYVTQILNGCQLQADIGISVLLERSLLKVDRYNKFDMHALLRDMGRQIVREKFPNEPEKHSRLWFHEDIVHVLTEHIGTIAIQGLVLKLPTSNKECLSIEAFKEMKRLRLLQLENVQLSGNYKHLSKSLRWLCWHEFPLAYMPDEFCQKSLVAIDLKHSKLKRLWKEPQHQLLERLKILNLSYSCDLTQTPIFTKLPNLEQLILEHCPSLIMVHKSIGELQNLLLVNLKDCNSLKDLPRSIYQVKSLKTLIISGCSLINKLEEDIEQMESLTHLAADNTAIIQVPFSLARSKSIGYISMCGYEGRAQDVLPSIIWSWLSPSNQAFGSISSQIDTSFPNLQSLGVKCDSNLQRTQDTTLIALAANDCVEFGTTPDASQISNMGTSAEVSLQSLMIQMGGCNKVVNALVERIKQGWATGGSDYNFLPGDKYPDWFVYKGEGSSVTLEIPEYIGRILKGMILCVVYSPSLDNLISQFLVSISILNHTKDTCQYHQQDSTTSFEDEKRQRIVSDLEPGDEVGVIVHIGHKCTVKELIAYLVYDDNDYIA